MLFEKTIRKIYNQTIKGTPQKHLKYDLKRSSLIEAIKFDSLKSLYVLKLKGYKFQIYLRDRPSSDFDVFKQIFYNKEYHIACEALELNFDLKNRDPIIIDAGANVGYTSFYFINYFKNAKIFSLEPDPANFQILCKNIEHYSSIVGLNLALSHKRDLLFDVVNSKKGLGDWAKITAQSENGLIKGITLDELISYNKLDHIDILKIDIEGAERYIFENYKELIFLKKTRILIMEIHDDWPIRNKIYSILKSFHFNLVNHQELTLGINTSLVKYD